MEKITGYLLMMIGSAIMILAFWIWITSDYPDISPFRFFGQFESGFWGIIQTQTNWLKVVLVGTPGLLLFQGGRSLIKRNKES